MVSMTQVAITVILIIVWIFIAPILLVFGANITDPFVQLFIIFIPIIAIIALIVKSGSRDERMGYSKPSPFK